PVRDAPGSERMTRCIRKVRIRLRTAAGRNGPVNASPRRQRLPSPRSPVILPAVISAPQDGRSMTDHSTDVAIIGAGPVGLFAVFECGMLKMRCHVFDALDMAGGQCAALYPEKPIYDIPGYPAIDAVGLIGKLAEQAAPFHPVYHLAQRVERLAPIQAGGFRLETS